MNKKRYLIVLILLVAVCGVLNSLVSEILENEDRALMVVPTAKEPVLLAGIPEVSSSPINYYTNENSFWTPEKKSRVIISEYDPIIRQVAADKGYDWRFISAIAYAESRFDHEVVSGSGAVGLMQIMPVVARQFKVDPKYMEDPHTNVILGVELLDYIGGTLRFPESTPEKDRLSIMLACYNCGMGHVLDARRLAVKYGENPNSWRVVSRYLELKNEPEYYEDEVVRCGQFIDNRQTLSFVKKVLRYYDSYCELAVL